jgi:hypothetical protein
VACCIARLDTAFSLEASRMYEAESIIIPDMICSQPQLLVSHRQTWNLILLFHNLFNYE